MNKAEIEAILKRHEAAKRGNATTGDVHDSLANVPLLVTALEEARAWKLAALEVHPELDAILGESQ